MHGRRERELQRKKGRAGDGEEIQRCTQRWGVKRETRREREIDKRGAGGVVKGCI